MTTQEYIYSLMKEREYLDPFRSVLPLSCKLIDSEIDKLLGNGHHHPHNGYGYDYSHFAPVGPPPTGGDVIDKSEKIFIPQNESGRGFNFVGRMLGPGGTTMKSIEAQCKCKIVIRGEGSMRIKADEDRKRGQPGYEHLTEPLHVLIQVHLPEREADYHLAKAREIINTLLVPPEAEDSLDPVRKHQLRELDMLKSNHSRPALSPSHVPPPSYGSTYIEGGYPYMEPPPHDYAYPYGVAAPAPLLPGPYYGQPPPSSRPPHKRSRPSH